MTAAWHPIPAIFADQVVPVDTAPAEHCAVIASGRQRAGNPIAGFDALIAAVCRLARTGFGGVQLRLPLMGPWTMV